MFTAKDLCSGYGKRIILKHISLTQQEGRLISLIGPNGSGKTTLLRVLAGLQGYSGNVMLYGHEVRNISRKKFARSVGFVMSGRSFAPSYPFSVREIIAMGRMPFTGIFSRLTPKDYAIIEHSADMAGVTHLLGRNIMTLSDGEKQLVLLASGLAQDTGILLLDEPTSSLDPDKSAKVFALLRRLADEGKSIIAAVHDINISLAYSDGYIALRDGVLISHGHKVSGKVLMDLYGTGFIPYSSNERNDLMWRALPE